MHHTTSSHVTPYRATSHPNDVLKSDLSREQVNDMWRRKLGLLCWNKPVANLYRDLEVGE